MSTWQITYGGVTQDAATWGIANLKRTRKSAKTGTVTFDVPGPIDGAGPFAQWQPLSILRNGVPWFAGVITKPPRKGSGQSESLSFEVSDPWYWLEKTVFQQQWVTTDLVGDALTTLTTTRSNTILGQSLAGVKMNSGQVMMEVLIYAQYAYQMLPFPATVDVTTSLPAAPAVAQPFIIGALTPSIVVPYMQVRDKSCADILRMMMKYSPDAVAWMDYTTTPPTLNIDKRASVKKNVISVLDGTVVTEFNPTPRYDLQVPVVVAKWEEKNTINGTTYDSVTVDMYPPAPGGVNASVWASQPRAWVQTIDLVGGQTTQQFANIKTIARPTVSGSEVALPWALSKLPWLNKQSGAGVYSDWDVPNISVSAVKTTIDPKDPLTDPGQNPNDITFDPSGFGTADCPQLVNELLTSAFPDWLQQDPNDLDAAKVMIEVDMVYSGSDAHTKTLFWYNTADPTVALTDGSGIFRLFYACKVTNADTATYSQLTSWSASEPVPVGFAEQLYNALAQLHFEGTLTMVEQECSDPLPIGCVFNTSDGLAAWQAMDALVLSVTEDIDHGTTQVQFGPPLMLGLKELEELFRASLGRLPSFKLSQRQTGKLTAGSNVIGNRHAADTHCPQPPQPNATAQEGPFVLTYGPDPKNPGKYLLTITLNGVFLNTDGSAVPITVNNVALVAGKPSAPINLNGNDTIWIEGQVAALACPTVAIKSYGNGDTANNSALTSQYWVQGGLTENDGGLPLPKQTFLRKFLAVFYGGAQGQPTLQTQQTTTNLQMANSFIVGEAAIYPQPI